jgi:hypothetical protein
MQYLRFTCNSKLTIRENATFSLHMQCTVSDVVMLLHRLMYNSFVVEIKNELMIIVIFIQTEYAAFRG